MMRWWANTHLKNSSLLMKHTAWSQCRFSQFIFTFWSIKTLHHTYANILQQSSIIIKLPVSLKQLCSQWSNRSRDAQQDNCQVEQYGLGLGLGLVKFRLSYSSQPLPKRKWHFTSCELWSCWYMYVPTCLYVTRKGYAVLIVAVSYGRCEKSDLFVRIYNADHRIVIWETFSAC